MMICKNIVLIKKLMIQFFLQNYEIARKIRILIIQILRQKLRICKNLLRKREIYNLIFVNLQI